MLFKLICFLSLSQLFNRCNERVKTSLTSLMQKNIYCCGMYSLCHVTSFIYYTELPENTACVSF